MMLYLILSLVFLVVLFSFFTRSMKPASSTAMSKNEAREVLGVSEAASEEEIQTAFNNLLKKNHPDVGGSKYLAQKIIMAKNTLVGK